MARFTMCDACASEYADPRNRRFHAQPIACPACGPRIELRDATGEVVADAEDSVRAAADALRKGSIVALKGLGGYQLLVDARNDRAVTELRRRKRRPDKPFAVMFPSIASAASHLQVGPLERELLTSKEAPIVLIERRGAPTHGGPALCDSLAPNNPETGAMLPYTPLHHLLMSDLEFPIVATSGNIADEPMIVDDEEAIDRLGEIADYFLTHNRPIASAVDDSVVRVVAGRALTLRSARGYAPWAMDTGRLLPSLVAYGGHLKSSCAVTAGNHIIVGPHIGDLESDPARRAWARSCDHLSALHDVSPHAVVCDRHPNYYTTRAAKDSGANVVAVQHHVAHVAACMAENELEGPVLGIVWDGTGYGDDATIWGGEFILLDGTQAHRAAHLRPFRLPGGERAIREPWRTALGILFETFGEIPSGSRPLPSHIQGMPDERRLISRMLSAGLNAPLTSSAGRLFDAAASLMGIVQRVSFEGQAAMRLEHAIGTDPGDASYDFPVLDRITPNENSPLIVDWAPAMRELLLDVENGRPVAHMATAFHNGLIGAIADVAQRIGEPRVVLTGGCFQNRFLTERAVAALKAAGFHPCWHRRLPPNDGGLAAGQAVYAARVLAQETGPCA
jgi:hydrogenase maturation protein HypF